MVGKIIEKSYKYNIPEPKELFGLFQEKLSKEVLPDSWEDSPQWTTTVLGIFNEIGRSLGYMPKKEYLRLDQTWEIRHSDVSTIVLALEVENTGRVEDVLDDELQKLLDIKAFLKVLIFYPGIPVMMQEEMSTYPEIQEKIQATKIKNSDEKYIVISATYVKPSSTIDVSACSFDSEGKGQELGDFQVNYKSKD
jgi:hypothetical protein